MLRTLIEHALSTNDSARYIRTLLQKQLTLSLIYLCRARFPRDPSKHWSSVGCYRNYSTEEFTICHCYHLTSYGLIMDVHGIYVRKMEQNMFVKLSAS